MAKFTTRVELHNAEDHDYDDLHAVMETKGFKRTVKGKSGATYHLPDATYRSSSFTDTVSDVANKAREAVKAVGKNGGIVVVQEADMYVSGLHEVIR